MSELEECSLFEDLSPDELAELRRVARRMQLAAGRTVFREGDPGDGLYVVNEGTVEAWALVGSGERCVFSKTDPGDFFGEMAVIDDKPRSASVTAIEDSVVSFVPREAMLQMLERSPGLSLRLLREITSRMREFNEHYIRELLQYERLALVGRFARAIVHDIKNPLNIISLSAEVAGQRDVPEETRRRMRDTISNQVERISDMIGEILAFTQGSQDTQVLGTTRYDQFVSRLIPEIRIEMELKEVSVESEEPPAVHVLLNPKRLGRVFYNLAMNASDAMPQGGTIRVRFQQKEKEVVTEFEDTGPGIAPEVADRLFEAFATFGKSHGTGLGLSICKKIIEDHHGRISARNGPSGGAIFSFSLPITA